MLEGMSGGFDSVGDGITRSIAEVRRLATSGSGGHMCVLFVFAFAFLLLVYLAARLL